MGRSHNIVEPTENEVTQSDYEKGLLVMASWQLASSNNVNELLAIMCTIRNWVVPKYGFIGRPMVEKVYYPSYSEAIEEFLAIYPVREMPRVNEPALVDEVEGMLLKVDGIYDCTHLDVTSSRQAPYGARYFGRPGNKFFESEVLQHQDVHPLIGSFGGSSFHA
jgi:hypothetical protein